MRRSLRSEQGSIYVEALVAAAILVIALVPIIGGFAITPAAQDRAGRQMVALNLARAELESLHALSGAEWDGLANRARNVTQGGREYLVSLTVASPRQTGLRDVRVTVAWNDERGNPQTVNLATSVARRP